MTKDYPAGAHIVSAVLAAFMHERPFWEGTEEQLYEELTRFKDDRANQTAIIREMATLETMRRKLVK